MQGRPLLKWLLQILLFALVLAAVGYIVSRLLRQTYLASPFVPHAGIALAVLLCAGRRLAPGVLLGQVAFVLAISMQNGSNTLRNVIAFSVGPLLTALAGEWLVRRFVVRGPLELSRPRQVMSFIALTGLVTPLVPASFVVLGLVTLLDFPLTEQLPGIWADFYLANAAGILIGAPITLAFIAQPRQIWAPRRLSLALPLALVALLLALALSSLGRWDHQQRFAVFQRDAEVASQAVSAALRESLGTLAATEGLLLVDPDMDEANFNIAVRQLAAKDDAIEFLAFADRSPDGSGLRLRHAARGHRELPPELLDDERSAVLAEMLAARPLSDGPVLITEPGAGRAAVLLVQPLLQSGDPPGMPREANGAVFAGLDVDGLVRRSVQRLSPKLAACLSEPGAARQASHLAGPAGCEQHSLNQPERLERLAFAGRQWVLRLYPATPAPMHASAGTQLVTASGVLSIVLLTALLLSFSGRAQRVEEFASQRTADLFKTALALRTEEQRFRSIFTSAPVGVYLSKLDGRLLQANPAFRQMLGLADEQALAQQDQHGDEDAALARQLACGHPQPRLRVLRDYTHADGRVVHAQLMMSLLHDAGGRPEALLCVAQDITDQLRIEAHDRARQAAELANHAKSEFLSRMSHELRTPLNGLLGFTQLLQLEREPLTPTQRVWTARIAQAGWHLLAMINDVLDLSRIETGNLRIRLEALDLHQLLDESTALAMATGAKRGIALTTSLAADARFVQADATRLREILDNLLSNAVKYNVDGGTILVRSRAGDDGCVEIEVRDTGIGLDARQLDGLFQPFNRLGQERGTVEGTGIGLVITRRLAEVMKGSLSVSSVRGEGSVFTLRLPAAGHPEVQRAPSDARLAPQHWHGQRRIAYVEDNAVNIEVMSAVVALLERTSLVVFEDGASALGGLQAQPPDLLLMDMHLPDTDGLTLLKRLRADPRWAGTPIVMVSADAMDEQVRDCLAAGASAYLVKPYAIHELTAMIDRLLFR